MNDHVSADLLAYQREQDRSEADHQLFAKRVFDEMVEDLMDNRAVMKGRDKVDLAFILDGEGLIPDWEAAALIAASSDDRWGMLLAIEERAKAIVLRWMESELAQGILDERVREMAREAEE